MLVSKTFFLKYGKVKVSLPPSYLYNELVWCWVTIWCQTFSSLLLFPLSWHHLRKWREKWWRKSSSYHQKLWDKCQACSSSMTWGLLWHDSWKRKKKHWELWWWNQCLLGSAWVGFSNLKAIHENCNFSRKICNLCILDMKPEKYLVKQWHFSFDKKDNVQCDLWNKSSNWVNCVTQFHVKLKKSQHFKKWHLFLLI